MENVSSAFGVDYTEGMFLSREAAAVAAAKRSFNSQYWGLVLNYFIIPSSFPNP